MKKTLVFAAVFCILLLLVSCSKPEAKENLPQTDRPFSAVIDIDFKDFKSTANLTFRNSAGATLEIVSPEEISTLVFTLSGEDISAQYKGLDFPVSELGEQSVSAARLIFSAISSAGNSKDAKISSDKNEFTVSGSASSYEYKMNFDMTSGAIKKFTVPSQNLSAVFRDFKFL